MVREIDRAAIASLGGDGYALMTKAAASAYRRLRARWPEARRIAVLCGQGNNGGDGFVLARLAIEAGLDAFVVRVSDEAPRTDDARRAREDFLARGGREHRFDPEPHVIAQLAGSEVIARRDEPFRDVDLIVDALFGIGLKRAPEGAFAAAIEAVNAARKPVLALDVPSGLDADTGAAPGAIVSAALTVCFVRWKAGLMTGVAADHVGELALETLGTEAFGATRAGDAAARGLSVDSDQARTSIGSFAKLVDARSLRDDLPRRTPASHKGKHGHVLVIGGDHGFGGAVRMAAESAARGGAGLVTVATREAHVAPMLAAVPETMSLSVERAADVQRAFERATVVAIGPGLGTSPWARELLGLALASNRALVLDADALNLLAEAPRWLPDGAIVTPHPGEAARMLGVSTKQVEANRYAAADEIAQRFRCIAVLKGAGTIISDGAGRRAVCAAAVPALASGGSGDVLTGVIAALRAQGCDAFDAARLGVVAHALAAMRGARGRSRGVIARDVIAALPDVLE